MTYHQVHEKSQKEDVDEAAYSYIHVPYVLFHVREWVALQFVINVIRAYHSTSFVCRWPLLASPFPYTHMYRTCMYVCTYVRMYIIMYTTAILDNTSNKNFILKYFRCRDGKRTETRIVSVLPIPAFHCTLCTCNT